MTHKRHHPIGGFLERHRHDDAGQEGRLEGAPSPADGRSHDKALVGQLFRQSEAELEEIEAYERSHEGRTRVLNKLHYLRQREPIDGYDAMSSEEVARALEGADLQ